MGWCVDVRSTAASLPSCLPEEERTVPLDLLIENGVVADDSIGPTEAALGIEEGKIVSISRGRHGMSARRIIDAQGAYVLPGVIDPHVHIGHGGPHAEEFWTEGASGAIGGVTTLLTYFRKYPFTYDSMLPELIEAGRR